MSRLDYVVAHIQPISGLLLGVFVLCCVGCVHRYGDLKGRIVRKIAVSVFRNQPGSERSADGLFMTITSFVLMISGMWIILAILYLAA